MFYNGKARVRYKENNRCGIISYLDTINDSDSSSAVDLCDISGMNPAFRIYSFFGVLLVCGCQMNFETAIFS